MRRSINFGSGRSSNMGCLIYIFIFALLPLIKYITKLLNYIFPNISVYWFLGIIFSLWFVIMVIKSAREANVQTKLMEMKKNEKSK